MSGSWKSFVAFVIVAVAVSAAGTAYAQSVDPYAAGWDAAYQAGASGQYDSALEAYNELGYAVYGPQFQEGFLTSMGFYEGQGMYGNQYPGAFADFKLWFEAKQGDSPERRLLQRQILVKGGARRVTRNFRRLTRPVRTPFAGDLIQDVSVTAGYSFASVDDSVLNGKGHDQEASVFLHGKCMNKIHYGLGLALNRYEITTAPRAYEQKTTVIDGLVSYEFTPSFQFGVFVNASFIDIEDEVLDRGIRLKGERYARWGGGLLTSYNLDLGRSASLGLTASVASMNKRSVERLFDDEDTAFVFMIDYSRQLTDSLAFNVYGSYLGLLDRETFAGDPGEVEIPDSSYWTWGADVSLALTPKAELIVGYETSAADNDHEEHRLNAGLVISF